MRGDGSGATDARGAAAEAGRQKALQDKLAPTGAEAMTTTPEQFAELIQTELPKWERIVKSSGATVD